MIKTFLQEYLSRNEGVVNAPECEFRAAYPYSGKAFNASYDFQETIVSETRAFCQSEGYDIDRISFVQVYDADIKLEESPHIRSHSDVLLQIVRRPDDKLEAVVFAGAYIEGE